MQHKTMDIKTIKPQAERIDIKSEPIKIKYSSNYVEDEGDGVLYNDDVLYEGDWSYNGGNIVRNIKGPDNLQIRNKRI